MSLLRLRYPANSGKVRVNKIAERYRTTILAFAALIAFASNSIICRLALMEGHIDAGSFSVVRLLSGTIALWMILVLSGYRKKPEYSGSWISAMMLFLYAFAFSYAYVDLDAGVGALVLFGFVQLTMLIGGIISGERPRPLQWIGLVLAVGGLVYLVFPGLTAPPLFGSSLMATAGIAWGIYSLSGRNNKHAVAVTTDNFIRAMPFVFLISFIVIQSMHLTLAGVIWAFISGAVTTGIGYIIWYAALRGLTATRAAVVQLTVPVLAAFGGVLFLSEDITVRLMLASVLTLGGVGIVVRGRGKV
jgi:drug/metabolite transporter (DMT)-like permease